MTAGGVAFANNCAACHGLGGAGQGFFPTLADDDWIWGGTLADIQHTITHGVRNGGEEARDSQMPRFGADQILTREQILGRDRVRPLADRPGRRHRGRRRAARRCSPRTASPATARAASACRSSGAPALNDAIWLYGGEKADIVSQIAGFRPRPICLASSERCAA